MGLGETVSTLDVYGGPGNSGPRGAASAELRRVSQQESWEKAQDAQPQLSVAEEIARRLTSVPCHDLKRGAAGSNASSLKRLIDVLGATLGLIALAPFLLLVGILIKLDSPGPVLFRQRRTGRGGVPFVIYKLRTMTVAEDGPRVAQATVGDPRVTKLGAFLRRSCIDELPQLINVLKGEMSLIGPRPHAIAHDAYYGQLLEDYPSRFLVRPGLSGLAQVSGYRGSTPQLHLMASRVELDLAYIRRWSLSLDIRLLVKTLSAGPDDSARN